MIRQSEFKKRFDPELRKYTKKHIYGGGIKDIFKSVGSKLFGKTMKKTAQKGIEKALVSAGTKTGEYAGKKAGDKIVQMLSKSTTSQNPPKKVEKINQILSKSTTSQKSPKKINQRVIKQKELNQMLNNLLSGGSISKRKII